MRARQRGVTAIGWLILLIPFAVIIYAGIRLLPIYMNYMEVARSLSELKSEYATGGATPDAIRSALQRRFDVEGLDYPAVKDNRLVCIPIEALDVGSVGLAHSTMVLADELAKGKS